jgi:hypothetical protein
MLFAFPENLFPHAKYDSHRMRVFALAISWISIVYCGIEGGVSIGLGAEVGSRALIVFGVQSVVEILSAALVIYRFHRELDGNASPNLSLERRATLGIGILFIILTIGTWIASIIALASHNEPDSSIPSLIVSACSLVLMIFVWLPKPWIATELNSSVMRAEAACSLACIYLTIVLLIGSLVYKIWPEGWWVDSTVAILLGFFFLYEGWNMIAWARNKDFNGGCCKTCSTSPTTVPFSNNGKTSSIECKNMNRCDSSEDESCTSKPLIVDKTCTNDSSCCSNPTKFVKRIEIFLFMKESSIIKKYLGFVKSFLHWRVLINIFLSSYVTDKNTLNIFISKSNYEIGRLKSFTGK